MVWVRLLGTLELFHLHLEHSNWYLKSFELIYNLFNHIKLSWFTSEPKQSFKGDARVLDTFETYLNFWDVIWLSFQSWLWSSLIMMMIAWCWESFRQLCILLFPYGGKCAEVLFTLQITPTLGLHAIKSGSDCAHTNDFQCCRWCSPITIVSLHKTLLHNKTIENQHENKIR